MLSVPAVFAAAFALSRSPAQADGRLFEADLHAAYAVGVVPNFVRDFNQPFDAWGMKYKSDKYRAFLAEMAAKGVPRTTFTQIYYPAVKGEGVVSNRAATTIPAPLPAAASGRQVTISDMIAGSEILAGVLGSDELAESPTFQNWDGYPYQAFVDAPMAEGRFPLIILVHGLGGSVHTFASAAEYLASQGYIAVTVSLTSDSASSPFAEDPSSPAFGLSDEEKQRIYRLRSQEAASTVFANFYKLLFGYDKPLPEGGGAPSMSELVAQPDGAARAGQSQADLFEQRAADAARVIAEMKYLNESEALCKAALEHSGYSKPLCGRFEGRIDVSKIGIMGHSLGSMTSQAAAAFHEDVDTVIGFNNGMPRMWEPWGGFPGDPVGDLPAGVNKPFLLVIGSDDHFVHNVFREIHWQLFKAAGGDPRENYPLALEQPWPTADNPQPVARASYERAAAEKMLLVFRDEGHDSAMDDVREHFVPGTVIQGNRVPLSPDIAQPETYEILGWIKDGGYDVYLPHLMRNYFAVNWFNWILKGDESARSRLIDHPFAHGVKAMMQRGVAPE